jgi:hypothetical protein
LGGAITWSAATIQEAILPDKADLQQIVLEMHPCKSQIRASYAYIETIHRNLSFVKVFSMENFVFKIKQMVHMIHELPVK